ncbi:MAG: hypothetical protein EBU08_11485 [Micrococcales bacterium]|nr:hypothetical protein [Micrococcales bacterium]NBS60640.1 hypothetical protein [Microbacteriaceae bacterium]NBS86255.1 hypothetical protein [Micrococcales bacterium]NBX94283.1 hypothetical protein [Actinomycetota bacterium]
MNSNIDPEKPISRPWMIGLGVFIAVLPILVAVLSTAPGGNAFGGAGGAALWFTLYTIPIGIFVAILGSGSKRLRRWGSRLVKQSFIYLIYVAIRDLIRWIRKQKG